MHVQIVNFSLKDLSHEAFTEICQELAPTFSRIPGLVSKVWLADPESNTYGGVYTWDNEAAMAAFTQSDLFEQLKANPHFADLTAKDYDVLESPSRVTRGIRAVAA